MKLARTLSILGLAAGASGALLFQGCSSDDDNTTPPPNNNDGGGQDGNSGGSLLHPPAPPSGAATGSTDERNFAINKLYLGTTDRDSTAASDTAWTKFGYDLDNRASTKTSTDVCTPSGSKADQEDGPQGIDNSFGKNVLPLLKLVAGTAQEDINSAITDGAFTVLLDVKGLTDDAAQTATGVGGLLLGGAKFSETAKPTFTASDDWPVLFDSVNSQSDAKSAKVQFPSGYVSNGVWVNGGTGDVALALVLQQGTVNLTIRKATITFEHSSPADAANGTIAGVIDTEEFIHGLDPVIAGLNYCSVFATVVDQIRAASDMLSDGTNTAGQNCNAISIGVGFTAKQIGQPTRVAAKAPPGQVKSCTSQDGGTGEAGP